MLVLFADTDMDMTPELANQLGYQLISMPYMMEDKEVYPYEDFEKFESKEYYNRLRKGVVPKTFSVNTEKYKQYFEPFLSTGNDILYVHFSKEMSGTFNALHMAIEELKEKYQDQTIYTLDTKAITIGSLPILIEVSKLYYEHKTAEEIVAWAETEVNKYATYFYADDLKFFSKSGRISNFSAIMGTILGIHPIIHMDAKGMLKALTKARGRVGSLKKIIDFMTELEEDIASYPIIIGHTDALELAKKFGDMIRAKFGENLNIQYVVVNPTAGAHCGPDSIGVCFHVKHR